MTALPRFSGPALILSLLLPLQAAFLPAAWAQSPDPGLDAVIEGLVQPDSPLVPGPDADPLLQQPSGPTFILRQSDLPPAAPPGLLPPPMMEPLAPPPAAQGADPVLQAAPPAGAAVEALPPPGEAPQGPEGAAFAQPTPTPDERERRFQQQAQEMVGDREILPEQTVAYCLDAWEGAPEMQDWCNRVNRAALRRVGRLYMVHAETSINTQALFDHCRTRWFPRFTLIDYCVTRELGLKD